MKRYPGEARNSTDMKTLLTLALILLILFPTRSHTQGLPKHDDAGRTKARVGLAAGLEKGFCPTSSPSPKSERFYSDVEKKRMVLKLTGPALIKWRAYTDILGSCAKYQPTWLVKDAQGVTGKIYRFGGGIITEYNKKAFFTSWAIAQEWWPKSGLTVIGKK
jgi:hypothetical protein